MKYQRILLTQPPTTTRHPQPPIGLAIIGAVLEKECEVLPILDGNFSQDYLTDLIKKIESTKPDAVGFTALTPTVYNVIESVKLIKEIDKDILVIIGGPHASVLPKKTLIRCPELDVAVSGEGEITIHEIMKGKPLNEIQGIAYRNGADVKVNPSRTYIKNLDSIPFPAYHLLENFPQGYKPHPPKRTEKQWASIITSRGCPYQCGYCSREACFGNSFRSNSPEYVTSLIKNLYEKYGVQNITFYDDVFTLNGSRIMKLCNFLLPDNLGFELIWDCETRVDLVNSELLIHMKKAGCHTIAYGIEHGLWIHDIKGGNATIEQAEKAIRWTHEANLNTIGYFMLGVPNETIHTIKKTIEFAKNLNVNWAQFSITTPIPGSDFYKKAIINNPILDDKWDKLMYESINKMTLPFMLSKNLSEEDLIFWRRQAYIQFYLRKEFIFKNLIALKNYSDIKRSFNGLKMLYDILKN